MTDPLTAVLVVACLNYTHREQIVSLRRQGVVEAEFAVIPGRERISGIIASPRWAFVEPRGVHCHVKRVYRP